MASFAKYRGLGGATSINCEGSWPRGRDCSVIYQGSWPRERECSVISKGSWLRGREHGVISDGSRLRGRDRGAIYEGSWPRGRERDVILEGLCFGDANLTYFYAPDGPAGIQAMRSGRGKNASFGLPPRADSNNLQ